MNEFKTMTDDFTVTMEAIAHKHGFMIDPASWSFRLDGGADKRKILYIRMAITEK